MSIFISILAFIIICLGTGSIINLVGFKDENFFEKFFISLGVGIYSVPLLGNVFNLCSIPLDYRLFLAVSVLVISINLSIQLRNKDRLIPAGFKSRPKITPADILVLIVFGITLFMYLKGSFSYPWFEDSDPWRFAAATKYVAINKTYTQPFSFILGSHPYPQGFQILMGTLNQINKSITWTMKFYNSLIISLSLIFFYLLSKKIFSNKVAALFSTITLASMPAWLSHFIFPYNLAVAATPLILYSLLKTKDDKKWSIISSLLFASVTVIHFYSFFIIVLIFIIYYLTKVFSENRLNKYTLITAPAGILLGILLFWLPVFSKHARLLPGGMDQVVHLIKRMFSGPISIYILLGIIIIFGLLSCTAKYWRKNLEGFSKKFGFANIKALLFILAVSSLLLFLLLHPKLMKLLGSGSMKYSLKQFLMVGQNRNLIQNPFGLGPVPVILGLSGFVYLTFKIKNIFTSKRFNQAFIYTFSIFTFLGVQSAHFAINLMPFRMWAFLSLSSALLCGVFYSQFIDKLRLRNWIKVTIMFLLIILLLPAWYNYKYKFNSHVWGENYTTFAESQKLYTWLKKNLEPNSKVYAMGVSQVIPIGYDMLSFIWDQEVEDYYERDISRSIDDIYKFLKGKGYEYILIDSPSIFYHKTRRDVSITRLSQETEKLAAYWLSRKAIEKKEKMIKSGKFEMIKDAGDRGGIFKIL